MNLVKQKKNWKTYPANIDDSRIKKDRYKTTEASPFPLYATTSLEEAIPFEKNRKFGEMCFLN